MFKKICAFFLSVLLVLNMVPVTVLAAAGADGSVSIRADKTQVSPGEEFDIYIGVNAKTDNLGSINFTVNMPEGLEYVSHEILVTMTDFMMSNYNPNTGVFGCAVTMTGKGGEFDVLKITVKAKDGAIGTQEFSVTLGTMGKLDGSTKMDYGTVEPVTINVSNYISQFNFVLPDEVDSVPAPVIGAKPVTESGHFGFEELGDGVMYADYYISTADNSVVYEFEPGTTYVEKVEITLFDGYSADANTKLPVYLEGFELDVENSGENTYVYTRTTAFDTVTLEEVTIDGTVEIPAAFEPMNKAEFTVSVPTSSAYYTFLEIKDGVSKEIEFPTDETYKPGYDYSQNITITLKDGYVFKEGFSAEDVILGEEFKDFVVTIYPTAISLNRYTNVEATISSIDLEGITGKPTLGEYYNPTVTTTTAGAAIEAYYMNGDAFAGEKITDGVYSEEIRIVAEEGYIIDPNVVINGADGFTIAQQTHRAIVLTRDTWVEKTEVAEVNFENFEVPATGEKAVYPVCSDDRFETTVRIYDQNNAVINPGDTYLGNTTYFVEVTLAFTEESKGIYKFGSGTQIPEGFAVDGDGTNYIVCTYMVDTAPAVLTGITVTGTPKTAYVYGENFDATGLTVTANYNDGTTKEVTDYTVETKLVPGVTEVTVSYDGKTAVIGGISVAKKELAITGIEAADRVYNGTTKVAVTGGELVGVIPGDDVYVTMPTEGSVATADAGEKIVAVAKPELMGAQADYYTLAEISGVSVNITAKPLAANMAENPADVTYNGKEQKPAVTVKDGEVLLIEGKDYNVVYKDNINIGTAEAVITGIGNYSGSVTKYFVIMQRNISVLLTANDKVYDGTNSAEVVFSGFEGVLDADKDKVFFDVNAGQSIFEGSYVGTHKVSFAGGLGESALSGENAINYRVAEVKVINEAKITEAEQIITVSSGEHKAMKNNSVSIGGWVTSNAGADAKIAYTLGGSYADVSISGTTLKVGKNAQLGSITIKAASAAVDVNGDGVNEYGAAETSFTAKIVNKNDAGLNAEDVTKTYGDADFEIGAVISEEAKAENGKWNWTVTGDAVDMEPGKETAEFAINKAGTAAVTVSYESEHYFGEKTITITVNAKDIVNNDFEEITSSYEYTGSEIRPEVVCKTGLVKDIDYTVEYSNNTKAGTASVIIKGVNNYKGTVNRSFEITAKAVEESAVTVNVPAEGYVYDGTAKEPSVSVAGLTEGVDYTVTYANNVNTGKAKVTVTFKGNYSGSYEEIFEIAQASVTVIFAAEDKVYDGTTAAEVAFSRFEGVAEADKESVTYAGTSSGNFASPYAGIHEVVFTGNAVLAGAKAQNYKVAAVKVEKAEITAVQQTVTVPAGQQSVAQNTTKDVKALAAFVEGAQPIFLAETALPEGVTLENGVLSVGASAEIGEVITVKVRSTAIDLNGDGEVEYLKAEDKFISFVIVAKADAKVSVTPSGIVKTYGDGIFGVAVSVANTAGEGTYSWVSSDEGVISLEGANTKNPTFKVGKAGAATVTVTYEDGTYLGSAEVKITVNPKDIAGFTVSGLSDAVYTGSAHTPAVTVKDAGKTLVQGTDYTVAYANNVNAGTAVVTVTGMGNYSGTIEKTFAITAKSIADVTVSGIGASYEYADGEAIRPAVTVTDGSTVLKENIDYTVEYSNNTEPGKASVTIEGKGNYSGIIEKTFVITAKNIVPKVEISGSYTYTGKPVHPAVTVKYGDKELSGGIDYAGTDKDYSISYENNVNAGTAKLTVTAKGANYTWTAVTKEFTINPADYTVSVNDSYSLRVGKGIDALKLPDSGNGVNGEKVEGTITLYYGSEILTDEISAELAAGEYSVTWKFVPYANANYVSEEKTGSFTLKVVEKESQTIEAPDALDFVYGGADKEIGAKVTVGDGAISYSSSDESVATVDANGKVSVHSAGTAVITVTAAETENYAEETKDIIVTVARKNVTKPTANSTVFTYNGEEQTYAVIANDAYTVSGNTAKDAGSYVVTVALKDKANTQWADGTTADIIFDFVINTVKVEKPVADSTVFTYNGEDQTYAVIANDAYTVSGNTAKDAGSYVVTVALKDKANTQWADGTTGGITFDFVINTVKVEKPVANSTVFTYNGEEQTYAVAANDAYTVSGNVAKDAGSYVVTVALKDKANTQWADGTTGDITFDFVINTVKVEKPVADSTVFTYNGKEQTYAVAANNAYTVSGNVAKDAGSYVVTVALKDKANTQWADGTTGDITFDFVIGIADYTLSVNDSYSLRVGKGISTLKLPAAGAGVNGETVKGTFTVYIGNDVLTEENSAKLAAGEYTVTWKFVPEPSANYVSGEKTGSFTLKVNEKDSQTIEAPDSLDFVYGGVDRNIGAKVTVGDGAISYSSSDESVATVDANGKVSVHSAGTAVITVTAAETENYAEETKNVLINVARKNIVKPEKDSTVFTYNGKEQTYAVAANDAYIVSGNTAKDAGSYVVTVALKDKANTQWADGTTADITFDFVINKAKVEKPDLEGLEFTYNGEEHRAVDPAEGYIVTGNGGKEAGDYNVTVTLDKNYEWTDGSEEVLTGSYTVEKATVTITAKNYVVTEGDKAPVLDESSYTVTGLAEGESLAVKPVIGYAETPNMNKAGKVEIVVSGSEVPNTNNYNAEIVYVSGVLTIEEKKDYDDDDSNNIIIDLTKPSTEREDESNPATGAPAMLAGFALLAAAAAFIGKKK